MGASCPVFADAVSLGDRSCAQVARPARKEHHPGGILQLPLCPRGIRRCVRGTGEGGGFRRKRCGTCGWKWYDNPPAVVLVFGETDDGRVLFARKSSWRAGRWGLVSGNIEDGETPEQTVIREVAEESGMVPADPVYVGSDVLPAQLLLCFTCRLAFPC